MNNDYDLRRFINAQDSVYQEALSILRSGMMCSRYMDFIFPRLGIRGNTPALEPYAIASLDEASAYLAAPVLGGRYRECIAALQHLADLDALTVFGDVDAKKLHASMTLFSEAGADEFLLETMLDAWFDSLLDADTMADLGRSY